VSLGPGLAPLPALTSLALFDVTRLGGSSPGASPVLRAPQRFAVGAGPIRGNASLEVLSTRALRQIPLTVGTAPATVEENDGSQDFRVPLLGAPVTESPVPLMFAFLLAAAGLLAIASVPERMIGNERVARGLAASRVPAVAIGLSLLTGVAAAYLLHTLGY
jgi:hypothetical protein